MPKPKKQLDMRMNAVQKLKLEKMLGDVEEWLAPVAAAWPALTPEQRVAVEAHSPVLARFLSIARQFDGG